jgi:hypothetical protein
MTTGNNDAKKDEGSSTTEDSLETVGISRRRLVYAAPAILLSRKLLYRAAGCGKSTFRRPQCRSAFRGS